MSSTATGTIGALISKHHAAILHTWTETARRATSARDLTALELSSLMPEYVSLLGRDGQAPEPRLSAVQTALIERHLSNRLREGFHLHEILTELAVLGRCVSRVLMSEPEAERPSLAEVAGLYAELYQTSTVMTRIFNEHVLEDEQTMKRYTRLLERIDGEPGSPGAAPAARLDEALKIILEAMGACTAALLMGAGTITRAAVGVGAAELAELAGALEASTSGARGGATGAAAGEVPVTPALRRLGVGALLRVRLSAPDGLRCVLCVGIAEQRSFTASEVRRFEGLSRALAVHLDNAHLRGLLRQRTHEVAVERAAREHAAAVLASEVAGPLDRARGLAGGSPELDDTLRRIRLAVEPFLAVAGAARGGDR